MTIFKKNNIFITIIIFFLFSQAFSKPLSSRSLTGNSVRYWGIKAGYTYSGWDVNSFQYKIKPKNGFGVGFFYNAPLNYKGISIRTEVLYLMKGTKSSYEMKMDYGTSGFYNYERNDELFIINEISLAPFVTYPINFGTISFRNSFFIEAGLELGLIITKKNKFSRLEIQVTENYNLTEESGVEYLDNFGFYDFSTNFGAGLIIGNRLHIDLRYSIGLSNILKSKNSNDCFGGVIKQRGLQIMTGISF